MIVMTVFHDGGESSTTYPPYENYDKAKEQVECIFKNGCELIRDGKVVVYPPWRIWRIEMSQIDV